MKHRISLIACAGLLALASVGCTTYINIPGQPGDVAVSNPDAQTVQDVTVPAVQMILQDQKVTGKFQVILPVKTSPAVAAKTAAKIDPNAVWQEAPDMTLPIYDVRQIRVRGMSAEIDIIRPVFVNQPDSGRQVATVYLHWDPFSGWVAKEFRVWRMSVENALRVTPYKNPPDDVNVPPTTPEH